MLTIIFMLGVFPVLFFYIGTRFEQVVEETDGESLAANYPAASPDPYSHPAPATQSLPESN